MLQVIFGSDNKQKQIYILAFHPDRCEVLSNLTTFSMIIHILESFEEGFMKYYVNNISGGGGGGGGGGGAIKLSVLYVET